jgi:dissimilatory sulfite reductase (desulfoviridin) alpha/beta subunit
MANVAPASVIYTGTTGPGQSLTTKTFSNVVDFEVDFVKNTVKITSDNGLTITYLDYSAITTFTWVITSGVPVLTIS